MKMNPWDWGGAIQFISNNAPVDIVIGGGKRIISVQAASDNITAIGVWQYPGNYMYEYKPGIYQYNKRDEIYILPYGIDGLFWHSQDKGLVVGRDSLKFNGKKILTE